MVTVTKDPMSFLSRLAFLSLSSISLLSAQIATTPLFWPDKNGPTYDGIVPAAETARLPLKWNAETGENIIWKTDLEDEGHSTPVIGGDRIWFTAASVDG